MDFGSIASGALSTGMDIWKAGRASDEASFARDWSRNMQGSQYQRTVADLRAAGLNPMLAYMSGPAGMPSSPIGAVPGGVTNPVSTALETKQTMAQIDVLKAQAENLAKDTVKKDAEATNVGYDSTLKQQLAGIQNYVQDKAMWDASSAKTLSYLNDYQLNEAKASSKFWEDVGAKGAAGKTFQPILMQILKMLK